MKKCDNKQINYILNHKKQLFYIVGFLLCSIFLFIIGRTVLRDTGESMNLEKVSFVVDEAGNPDNDYMWTGHFDRDIHNKQLMLFMHYARVRITKNDQFYGEYGYKHLSIGKTCGEEWECFEPAEFSKNDTIKIRIENVYQEDASQTADLLFSNIFVGDKLSLTKYNIHRNLLQIILAFLIIITGIIMMIVITTLKSMGMKTPTGYVLCGVLLIVGAVCTLIDYDYISLLFNHTFFFITLDLLTQTLIVEFLLMFMKVFIKRNLFRKIANVFLIIWTLMIVLYLIAQIVNVHDGTELVPYYIIPAIFMIVMEIIFMIIDYSNKKDYMAGGVIYSGIILCVFTFIEMFHFTITKRFYIVAFQSGLFIFTVSQFIIMIHYIRDGLEQTRRANELEKELMQSRISIMLSQIQPHFLYNSLGSISQLCTENPKKAEKALDQFADFLRGNMQSLSCNKPILFQQELMHLKNYIELEKIRFGDRIRVKYLLEVEDFHIPALTLQPIVENSIRYGITKKREGGTVEIRTQKINDQVIIRISDDGVGFDPYQTQYDGRTHIGIKNVKSRIHEMCNGEMVIDSKPGVGTIVTIVLKEENKDISNENFDM